MSQILFVMQSCMSRDKVADIVVPLSLWTEF